MPDVTYPGVYVDESGSVPRPIEGVSTSVTAFLGPTARGPETLCRIFNWGEFNQWFGGHLGTSQSFLSYAVQGFFENGGRQCWIGRIVGGPARPAEWSPDPSLLFLACGRGTWGQGLFARVVPATAAQNGSEGSRNWIRMQVLWFHGVPPAPARIADPFRRDFRSRLLRRPDVIEDFDNLSLDPGAPNFLCRAINGRSRLIRVRSLNDAPELVPGNSSAPFTPFHSGAGGLPSTLEEYVGTAGPVWLREGTPEELLGAGTGFEGLEAVEDVSLVVVPDQVGTAAFREGGRLTDELLRRCEQRGDRLAILSAPRGLQPSRIGSLPDSSCAAMYYPWIWIDDPASRSEQLVPPAGHVAGIFVQTDEQRGVAMPPTNVVVAGARNLEKSVSRGDQDLLVAAGINPLRDLRGERRGIRVWGSQTLSRNPEWKYVFIRRLMTYLEKSIDRGTQWVVFERNTDSTWSKVRGQIEMFLMTVWRDEALSGSKPEEAFFVRCDRTTMTEDDLANGRLICVVGVAVTEPAEFVIFRIEHSTAGAGNDSPE